jgi:hypothetical protein
MRRHLAGLNSHDALKGKQLEDIRKSIFEQHPQDFGIARDLCGKLQC